MKEEVMKCFEGVFLSRVSIRCNLFPFTLWYGQLLTCRPLGQGV